ncbi:hypothetical protein KP509_01G075700 [Ceratopteris richardii]|uniref:Cytochrome c oxidase subunit 3 n=1 Tax=Ceratopteris richardii TaxID=49495 RepID=A0A8T2VKY0_CERRI|nr:hypothetical protein KP509_01G075700 [Ceratopteris richardii]
MDKLPNEEQEHPYHLVDPSQWTFLGSLRALANTSDRALLTLSLGLILYAMFVWWHDVTCESTYEGNHTKAMFSLAFFWEFLHSPLARAVEIAAIRPHPQGMEYYEALFTIFDGFYGSTFYLATTFHGFHVIIGTILLIIHATTQYRYSLDVVWIFLFASIYW